MDSTHQAFIRQIVADVGLPVVLSELVAIISEQQIERAEAAARLEPVPASRSQIIALDALCRRRRDLGETWPAIHAHFKSVTGVPSREELTSASAAKVVHAFEERVQALEHEHRSLSVGPAASDVPF